MSRICELCSRGAQTGNRRSHSNIAVKRLQKINLQKFKVAGISKLVCTKCLRTMNREKAQ